MGFTDEEITAIRAAVGKGRDERILSHMTESAQEDYLANHGAEDIFDLSRLLLETYDGREKLLVEIETRAIEKGHAANAAQATADAAYLKLLRKYGYITQANLDQMLGALSAAPMRDEKYAILRRYLLAFPYGLKFPMETDISSVAQMVEEQLYGMRSAKDAILEFIALWLYSAKTRPPAVLLSGPPGVGKTAFAYAVARALGLPRIKISFAGLFDAAVLQGFQFGWMSSTPGIIFTEFTRVRCVNPVVIFDEIEKRGRTSAGSVDHILVELLNPDQSCEYRDNFMGFTVDLSRAFFICTANDLDSVPGYIKDRCHVIEIPEYTPEERMVIVKRYLPGQLREEQGLNFDIDLSDQVVDGLSRITSLREAKRRMLSLAARKLRDGEIPGERLRIDSYDEASFQDAGVRHPIGFAR